MKTLSYDYNDHKGVALWQFTITEKGTYTVEVAGNEQADSDATVAFGRSIGKSTAIGGVLVVVGVLLCDRGDRPADRRAGEAQPAQEGTRHAPAPTAAATRRRRATARPVAGTPSRVGYPQQGGYPPPPRASRATGQPGGQQALRASRRAASRATRRPPPPPPAQS